MNCNQPIETLSKNHFKAYNQIYDDYKNLAMFEQEMEAYVGFQETEPYQNAQSKVKRILERIISNKAMLGWNYEAEQEQYNTLNKKL